MKPRHVRIDALGAVHHLMVRGITRSAIFYDSGEDTGPAVDIKSKEVGTLFLIVHYLIVQTTKN